MKNITLIEHPLVQNKLTLMRKKETSTAKFRNLMRELSLLLGYEVTRHLPTTTQTIETPLAQMEAPCLEGKQIALVSILRAGSGIVDGLLQLMPTAKVGHIGLYRDPQTHSVIEYYCKFPEDISNRRVLLVDPLLATGASAIVAVNRLKQAKPKSIQFLCVVAAPEGVRYFNEQHPDVSIYTAAVDEKLNDQKYIIPGLGDAGDRIFGTH